MKKKKIIIFILFIIIISMRIPHINNSPAEYKDMWRQVDTESIARNFVKYKFNIFYPQLNYDGPMPNYVQLEFQITTFLIALLYKIFGHNIILARIVPIFFFTLSCYFLFRLTYEIYDYNKAILTTFIYSVIPLNLFYSRAIMPESALLCFLIGSYYFFYKWIKYEKDYFLLISALFTSLAISQKIPAVFIGLAMLGLCINKFGYKFLLNGKLWIFSIISLLPPILYFKITEKIAEFKFVSGIAKKHIFPNFYKAFFTKEAYYFLKNSLNNEFTIVLLILSIIGLIIVIKQKEFAILLLVLAIILEVILIVSVIKLNYYLILLTVIVSILSSRALLFSNKRIYLTFSILLIVVIPIISIYKVKDSFKEVSSVIEFSNIIDEHTKENELIVVGTYDPARISLSNRQGYRANLKYYDFIPKDIEGEVKFFRENNVKYFIVENNYIQNDDGSYIKYLNENFGYININNKYKFFILNEFKN